MAAGTTPVDAVEFTRDLVDAVVDAMRPQFEHHVVASETITELRQLWMDKMEAKGLFDPSRPDPFFKPATLNVKQRSRMKPRVNARIKSTARFNDSLAHNAERSHDEPLDDFGQPPEMCADPQVSTDRTTRLFTLEMRPGEE